jgi:hypothetical protein
MAYFKYYGWTKESHEKFLSRHLVSQLGLKLTASHIHVSGIVKNNYFIYKYSLLVIALIHTWHYSDRCQSFGLNSARITI